MDDLIVAEKIAQWHRLKALVLDSVSSPITKRVYSQSLGQGSRVSWRLGLRSVKRALRFGWFVARLDRKRLGRQSWGEGVYSGPRRFR
jgi:hypothetical protein